MSILSQMYGIIEFILYLDCSGYVSVVRLFSLQRFFNEMYFLASLILLSYLSLARGHPLELVGSGKIANIGSPSL